MMRSRVLVGVLVVGLIATAIAVAEGGRATRPEPFEPFTQHVVGGPGKAAGSASKARFFRKTIYLESNNFTVAANEEENGFLRCPRHSSAISGYFGNNRAGVVLDYSAIAARGKRRWDFGVLNLDPNNSARAFVGVVCIKR
jgi:hypothetical protein